MNFNGIDFNTYFKHYPDKNGYFGKYGMVWCNYPGRTTISGTVAYVYSPSVMNIAPAYELSVHHLLPVPADQSLFPIRVVEVGK